MHRIHLKGPWEYEWLRDAAVPPAPGPPSDAALPIAAGSAHPPDLRNAPGPGRLSDHNRVHMPATWQSLFGAAPGTARFRRRFNRPTNLDPDERVFIVFDGIGGRANISLNGRFLGSVSSAACPAAFDVTPLLTARNELTVDLAFDPEQHPGQPGGLWAPVALEIRRETM